MNAPTRLHEARRIVSGTTPETLEKLVRSGVAAAVWRRRLDPDLAAILDNHPSAALVPLRVTLPASALRARVGHWARSVGLPVEVAGFLAEDAADLGARFARLLGTDRLAARIDVLADNACGRFHVDRMRARLLCTWRGPGTELAVRGADGAPEPVGHLSTGAAAILRGTLWPGAETTALLHRSPPIEGSGTTRVLLVLDPGDDCACC